MKIKLISLSLVIMLLGMLCACQETDDTTSAPVIDITSEATSTESTSSEGEFSKPTSPESESTPENINGLSHELFNGKDAYMVINDGKPFFTKNEITTKSFETYAPLDSLGRCGVTFACVGKDIMPTEDRESISSVYPSGWKYNGKSNNKPYDFVDGKYIYNRCHLIGFQLTGENANKQNLITGTRYLNIDGMLTFENMVADAVKENNLHVMYRVTPIYQGNNLVPEGVLIEALSVEDNGDTIECCVFSFNVQPGVTINYATGENWLSTSTPTPSEPVSTQYVINKSSKKFHVPSCASASNISAKNREERSCTRDTLIAEGYTPCGACKP